MASRVSVIGAFISRVIRARIAFVRARPKYYIDSMLFAALIGLDRKHPLNIT
jgi:hypothetical protein